LREELSRLLAGEGVAPEFIAALREADTESALAALTLDYTNAQLGDFRLGRSLGQGATGVVHEAVQLSVDRTVAVKVLAPMMVSNAERLERFRREAYSQSRLRHPHVASAFYFGSAGGIPYLAMERVRGKSLREHIAGERKRLGSARAGDPVPQFDPFDPRTAAETIAKVAAALDYCHRQGENHRDIKPNNILIDEDFEPRIIDFGIARDQSLASMTRTRDVSGTPWYMSPEQARARKHHVSHRTDVYSAGAVLYEMLAHQPPFPGTDSLAVLDSICNDRLRPVRSLNPEVPHALALICHKALEKDPARRYATALELADDLRSFLAGGPVVARSPSIARKT
jgi:serine/threonine protein kinase